jgi:hypothetical protein
MAVSWRAAFERAVHKLPIFTLASFGEARVTLPTIATIEI